MAFVDLHASKSALDNIIKRSKKEDIDLVINAGDFTIFGEDQKFILDKLNKIKKPILNIHGNHEDDRALKSDCKKFKNCYFIHKNTFRVDNYLFIGWGGGGFSFRDKEFEKESKKLKKMIRKDDKVILITHAPPYKTKIDEADVLVIPKGWITNIYDIEKKKNVKLKKVKVYK